MTDRISEIKEGLSNGLDWDDRARKYYVDVQHLLTELERLQEENYRLNKFTSSDAQDLNNLIVADLSKLFNLKPGEQGGLIQLVARYKQAAEMLKETVEKSLQPQYVTCDGSWCTGCWKDLARVTLKETAWMEETP